MWNQWRVEGMFWAAELALWHDALGLASPPEDVQTFVAELPHFARDPAALGALREICGALYGAPGRWASDFDREVVPIVREALESGRVVLLSFERREPAAQPLVDGPGELLLGLPPLRDAPDSTTWIGLRLVNQNGDPVPGRAYRVVAPDGTLFDGTLDQAGTATLNDMDPGTCKISCPYVTPHPSTTHLVSDGEHISGIAFRYGFDDYTVVWSRSENADLRSERPNPHELVPEDEVFVPALANRPVARPTGARHIFVIQQSPLKLRLRLLGLDMSPVTNALVTILGAPQATDGDGMVGVDIDKTARVTFAKVCGTDLALQIGRLAPIDDPSDAGWRARLFNLGFLWDPNAEEGDEELHIALEDFQAECGLPVTGAIDDATMGQLAQVHGC
jgi:hypothetical protein